MSTPARTACAASKGVHDEDEAKANALSGAHDADGTVPKKQSERFNVRTAQPLFSAQRVLRQASTAPATAVDVYVMVGGSTMAAIRVFRT